MLVGVDAVRMWEAVDGVVVVVRNLLLSLISFLLTLLLCLIKDEDYHSEEVSLFRHFILHAYA